MSLNRIRKLCRLWSYFCCYIEVSFVTKHRRCAEGGSQAERLSIKTYISHTWRLDVLWTQGTCSLLGWTQVRLRAPRRTARVSDAKFFRLDFERSASFSVWGRITGWSLDENMRHTTRRSSIDIKVGIVTLYKPRPLIGWFSPHWNPLTVRQVNARFKTRN
jgi:hypothetical protein